MNSPKRIRQSVCRWCFEKTPIEELARESAAMGLLGIDLVNFDQWDILKNHGLVCTMAWSHPMDKGLNDPANHPECVQKISDSIEKTADAGFANVLCFSGNRKPGISDEDGLKNCATAIKQVIGLAEKRNVTLCIELLNSKLNHHGYLCDRTDWGAALVNAVGSERFKLLYDIYHMQVQEGDVIATIRKYKDVIGHYHTGGVPGRAEIDDGQELFYPAIMRAIAEAKFAGYVAHEFIPKRNPLASLREAIQICDI